MDGISPQVSFLCCAANEVLIESKHFLDNGIPTDAMSDYRKNQCYQ